MYIVTWHKPHKSQRKRWHQHKEYIMYACFPNKSACPQVSSNSTSKHSPVLNSLSSSWNQWVCWPRCTTMYDINTEYWYSVISGEIKVQRCITYPISEQTEWLHDVSAFPSQEKPSKSSCPSAPPSQPMTSMSFRETRQARFLIRSDKFLARWHVGTFYCEILRDPGRHHLIPARPSPSNSGQTGANHFNCWDMSEPRPSTGSLHRSVLKLYRAWS